MKTNSRCLLLLFIATAASAAPDRDIRTINGAQVDLAPIHQWTKTGQGEQPLKAWKSISVKEIRGQVAAWPKCFIQTEDGYTEVLLQNAEPVVQPLRALAELDAKIAALQGQATAGSNWLSHTEAKVSDYNRANINNPDAPYLYVKDTAKLQVRDVESEVARLRVERQQAAAVVELLTATFALSTGKTYAGLPIWDCGLKRTSPNR